MSCLWGWWEFIWLSEGWISSGRSYGSIASEPVESVRCVDVAEDGTAGKEVVESTVVSSLLPDAKMQHMRVFRYRRGMLGFVGDGGGVGSYMELEQK